jgi:hypothetical protein
VSIIVIHHAAKRSRRGSPERDVSYIGVFSVFSQYNCVYYCDTAPASSSRGRSGQRGRAWCLARTPRSPVRVERMPYAIGHDRI